MPGVDPNLDDGAAELGFMAPWQMARWSSRGWGYGSAPSSQWRGQAPEHARSGAGVEELGDGDGGGGGKIRQPFGVELKRLKDLEKIGWEEGYI